MVHIHEAVAVVTQHADAPVEPILDVADIQGNAAPGFMKPNLAVIAFAVSDTARARPWIASLIDQLTTIADIMPTRQLVRQERLEKRVTAGFTDVVGDLDDCWMNVGFTYQGLSKLLATDDRRMKQLALFSDPAFVAGLATRSSLLGDPTDPQAEGNPANWVVGRPGTEPDIVLVIGADRAETMGARIANVRSGAASNGVTVLYEEAGQKLDEIGSEQFGFQDGISQPGVRGRTDTETYLSPRVIDPTAVPEAWMYGLPGQYLVWPGEFVFGYETEGADPRLPALPKLPGPGWCHNGSYLVFRRLRQDVAGFRAFVDTQAALVQQRSGFEEIDAATLASLIVGRWPSGAPVSRTPDTDDTDLGKDPLANNHFGFGAQSVPLPLRNGAKDTFPEAGPDPIGLTCPLAAHIRKVNARDLGSDQGGRRASFNRRILRRGLPFGPPLPTEGPDPVDGNRGLLFLSYQTSIADQFEFLNTMWMGDPTSPRAPSGHDMFIGQNGQPGENRARSSVLLAPDGEIATVNATSDYVIATGGGYFFCPSISALRDVIAASPPRNPISRPDDATRTEVAEEPRG